MAWCQLPTHGGGEIFVVLAMGRHLDATKEVDKPEVVYPMLGYPEPHVWAWTRAPALFPTQVVYTRQCGLEHHIKLSVKNRSCKDGLMTRKMLLQIFACFFFSRRDEIVLTEI